ncbi:Alpha/Beta hydrolase protein [Fomitopsis serialis]|uniref:Alpha/Beta hydrolase protein n=1 Tax=Fomitopsis serialis TaxID=139415 RepID=UPI002007C4BB|nr:Alpha/Beta hydrolase protein [Neoantrodia serialis]KAH9933778.1 Alpha/Beta hydrolase protein [Neoantrodia serialis]
MASYSDRLPAGVSSRSIAVADLDLHVLEAGDTSRPLIVLLHGFPELAFSWRKVIVPIAQLGYRVVVPDQRGFGRTRSRSSANEPIRYEDDLRPYRVLNVVRDAVALVYALGYRTVAAVIGHDLGSRIAAYCTLIRPDIFQSVIMMSAPFDGPPSLPFDVERTQSAPPPNIFSAEIKAALAALDPPRKHYVPYLASPQANSDMMNTPQGLHAFLRAFFHTKSADWPHNDPHPLAPLSLSELAQLPPYYMMPLAATMPEAVAPHAPSREEVEHNQWLSNGDLAVYVAEYGRTGFQGGLNWYRGAQPELYEELAVFEGRKIECPAMFLSGRKDWGVFQAPGALQRMKNDACARLEDEDIVLVDGAGHWVQQEQPEELVKHVERFLEKVTP